MAGCQVTRGRAGAGHPAILHRMKATRMFAVFLPLLASTLPASTNGSDALGRKPNVLIILADDLGYHDLGCQGSRDIPTPNIDRIAADGLRMTSGYVSWSGCAPSRAGIITGRDSHRFGFYSNPTPVLANDQGLPPHLMTVPAALRKLGYVTGGIGKWHLGSTYERHPLRMGFAEWFGFLGGAHDYFPREHYGKKLPRRPWPEWFVNQTMPLLRNDEPATHVRYITDQLSDEAVAFIQRHKRNPFYLYLAYNAPHSPWESPNDELAKHSLGEMTKIEAIPPEFRRTYVAMVSRLDAGVGRVLAALQDAGIDDDTLVFFLSDNGGGPNTHGGKPGYPSSNAPLRGSKGTLYEGGIRVPFLVRWKGTLPAGKTYDHPVSSFDIGATALSLAGSAPAPIALDGVNLLPHLNGRADAMPHQRLFWKQNNRGAIREGRYKLLTGKGAGTRELYDLEVDPGEMNCIAEEEPAIVDRLDAAWRGWNAEMPPPLWITPPMSRWTEAEYQPPLLPQEKRGL